MTILAGAALIALGLPAGACAESTADTQRVTALEPNFLKPFTFFDVYDKQRAIDPERKEGQIDALGGQAQSDALDAALKAGSADKAASTAMHAWEGIASAFAASIFVKRMKAVEPIFPTPPTR